MQGCLGSSLANRLNEHEKSSGVYETEVTGGELKSGIGTSYGGGNTKGKYRRR